MHGSYDRALMKRGEVARRLISEGEDPSGSLLRSRGPVEFALICPLPQLLRRSSSNSVSAVCT